MVNLDFKKYHFGVDITFISEDGTIEEFKEIQERLQRDINDVVNELIIDKNNVVAFEWTDVAELSDGDSQ